LSISEGVELATSLIKDTLHQLEVVKWKQTHIGKGKVNMDLEGARRIGPNYLHGIPMLREKKHVKFDQNKDDFVKPELFHGM
jgi:hypothetical protein